MIVKQLLDLDQEACVKVKWGQGVTDGRGKQGGAVFSRNRGGAYIRNKVTPSNPKSASQTLQRNQLANYSQGWRGLTDAQRNEWNAAAPNFPYTDQFGDTYILSGQNLYIALNTSLIRAGGTAITAPPTAGSVSAPTTMTVTMAKGTPAASVAFTVSPVPANTGWNLYATTGMSAGRSFVSSQLRYIATIPAAGTTPYNALTAYTTKFGVVPSAGQKVFWQIVPVNLTTGQQGTPLRTSVIVSA